MPIMCFSQSMAAAALRVLLVLMLLLLHEVAAAQTYGPGAIAGVFFGTFLGTLALCAAAFAIWFYATNGRCPFTKGPGKREKSADVEEGKNDVVGKHGHDNPNFHDDVDIVRTAHGDGKQLPAKSEKSKKDKDGKVKEKGKGERKGLGPFKIGTGRKQQAVDDISLNYLPPEVVHVPLKSHDIVGLGINIQGNMTDGIFISNVLSRGPASESGKVQKGDRILSVRVSFRNVTYEDALTILSYGSPYDVELELEKARAGPKPSPPTRAGSTRGGDDSGLCSHPMYRSRSTNDLDEVDRGEAVARRLRSSGIMTRRPAATTTATGTTSVAEQYVQSSASTRSLNERFLVQAAAEGENGKAGKISVRDIAIAKPKRAPPRVMAAGGAPEVAHDPTTATRKEEEMVVRDDYGVDGAVRREDEKEEKTSKKEEKEKEKTSKGKEKKDKKKDKEAKIIIAGGGGESEKKDEKEDEKKSTSSSSSSNSSSSSSSSSDIDGKEKSEKKKVKKLTKLKKDKVKGKDKDKKKEKKEKSKDKKVKSNEVENDATRYKEVEIAINERGIDIGEQKTERLISTESEISTITTTTTTTRTEVDHQQQATPDLLKEVRTDVATEPTTKTRKMAPPKPSPRRKSQELKPGDVGHQPPPLPASPPPDKHPVSISRSLSQVSPVATSVHYMQTTADGRVHEVAPSGGANTITISTGKPVVHEDVTFTVTTNKPTSTPVTSATVTSSSQVKRSSIDVQQVYTETAHLY
ncbi:PREDICTED: muscle M-line assembly protein unc-89-like [Priapulus caudatus]|uniref:Muscle M-line assembly protein unc-89-like n=1 Tax=Priapulus caudatus TaxID=37621 RepID=A0ABM1EQF3_PRICU|nr:PREDICTED: muscle M-line assembly protein unc-89-like [Priapulus caudatus]